MKLLAKKLNGKLIYKKSDIDQIISQLPENKDIIIEFRIASELKTREQLGYFFAGIVKKASEYFGWTEEEMYEWLMSECNKKPVVNKFTGEINYCAFGLSHNNKQEMRAVIERAIMLLAEHGFVVDDPELYL